MHAQYVIIISSRYDTVDVYGPFATEAEAEAAADMARPIFTDRGTEVDVAQIRPFDQLRGRG